MNGIHSFEHPPDVVHNIFIKDEPCFIHEIEFLKNIPSYGLGDPILMYCMQILRLDLIFMKAGS